MRERRNRWARVRRGAAVAALVVAAGGCGDMGLPGEAGGAGGRDGATGDLVVPAPQAFTGVAAGFQFGCGVQADGLIKCWGLDVRGGAPALRPAASGRFTQVASGDGFTCGLRDDGAVECFGADDQGTQAGTYVATAPYRFVQVAEGNKAACGLRDDGAVECWGEDDFGQAPALRTATASRFVRVSVGGGHGCGLRADGAVECWGDDSRLAAPPLRTAPGGYVDVSAGARHSCAVRADGVVECWGENIYEQAPPTRAPVAGTFARVSAGTQETCALRDDGVIECWGDNSLGSAPPTVTAATGRFTAMDFEGVNGCGLRTDGLVQCWGRIFAGPYAAAPTTTRVSPAADFLVPPSVIASQPIPLELARARVPGYPSATAFTYAFDCGAGFGAPSSSATGSCATTAAGSRTVRGRVIDQDGDQAEYAATVRVLTVAEGTRELQAAVAGATLTPDLRKALLAKLSSALVAIDRGRTAAACTALSDFIAQASAQRGKAIDAATADAWIGQATQLRAALGCR
jgi:hypothetical protein